MKILTLNTHSLAEKNYSSKLKEFVAAAANERYDIIAMQEVNQTCSAENAEMITDGYNPCSDRITIKEDNHLLKCTELLEEKGVHYFWTWLPIKKGYGKYDEGIGIMSLSPIKETAFFTVSNIDDADNWKTRKILGIKTESYLDEWFFSVHFGWWNDEEEPFASQWKNAEKHLKGYRKMWLMGDFNNPAHVRSEGYDMVKFSGWNDTYELAAIKDTGITVREKIDGWNEETGKYGIRIDQIWCSEKIEIKSSQVVLDGKKYPVVSDHYGVEVEY